MATIKVWIGREVTGNSGITNDNTRQVEFEAAEVAQVKTFGTGRDGAPTDTRGTVETLYRTPDDRLIVHVKDWSHWQGEPTVYTLHEVTAADLGPTGRFTDLGHEAGYGRPLTLAEALTTEGAPAFNGPYEEYDEEAAAES